jgi:nucleoid DNA-binding protein
MPLKNLTKREIVLDVFKQTGFPQQIVRDAVQLTLDTIVRALADGRNVELRKFGVFEVQLRKARIGRNPNKPEDEVEIPERAVVKFKPGKELKEELIGFDLRKLEVHTKVKNRGRGKSR